MKSVWKIVCLTLALVLTLAALPLHGEETYRVGIAQEAIENAQDLQKAFEDAVSRFADWSYQGKPSGHVTKEGDHYMQTFSDGAPNTAAVYVGADRKGYVMRGPIWQQITSLGGYEVLGAPTSDAYEKDGVWYQNFRNGHVEARGSEGNATFVKGSFVDDVGQAVSDVVTDLSKGMNSASSVISDVASNVKSNVKSMVEPKTAGSAPHWVAWLVVIALLIAVLVLGVMCFKRKR